MSYWRTADGVLMIDESKTYLVRTTDIYADVLKIALAENPDMRWIDAGPDAITVRKGRAVDLKEEIEYLKHKRKQNLQNAEQAFSDYQHFMVKFKSFSDQIVKLEASDATDR